MDKKVNSSMFEIGDTVMCITDIGSSDYEPKKNEIFTITSIAYNWIGFPLSRLPKHIYENDTITGKKANWGTSCFIKIGNSKMAKVLWQLK